MTIQEFMESNKLKSKKTVEKWLDDGLIPGSRKNENKDWTIPEMARPPYTQKRAKSAPAIYTSIVKACIQRLGVCAKLYGISEIEFNVYIECLEKEGLIAVKTVDDIPYYFATPKSETLTSRKGWEKRIKSVLCKIVEATALGITKGTIEGLSGH